MAIFTINYLHGGCEVEGQKLSSGRNTAENLNVLRR